MLIKYKYTFNALIVALTIPSIRGAYHYFTDGVAVFHYLPQTPHDRVMALTVSAILLALGFFADYHNRKLISHEKEKRQIFISAVGASQHILNNFLNNMLYFQQQATESRALDEQTLKLYDEVIHGAAEQLKKLGEISDISEQNIRDTIYPK